MNKSRLFFRFAGLCGVFVLLVSFLFGGQPVSASPLADLFSPRGWTKSPVNPVLNPVPSGMEGNGALSEIGAEASTQSLDTGFEAGANGAILTAVTQADGKILVGGKFTKLGGGGTGTTTRNYIGRFNADGTLDTSFNPGSSSWVYALAVQEDGKILVGGSFSKLGDNGTTTRNNLGRLNANGTLDTSFDPGANDDVNSFAVQADGKILVGGAFTMLGGGGTGATTRNRIGRLNANGSPDTSFDPGANGTINKVAVQPDGKILVGGAFTTLGGGGTGTTTRNRIGRLNANGSLDTTFDPGANNEVKTFAVQADGKILVGGAFTGLGGGTGATTRYKIGRINANGSLDTTFDPGAGSSVWSLALQSDGKILVGGDFSRLGGGLTGTTERSYIGRLSAQGVVDATFDPGANFAVRALEVQPEGKILAGGYFTTFGGGGEGTAPFYFIARLNADGSAPIISTGEATGIGSTDATLNGTVNPNGSPTTVSFEYGLTTGYGSQTSAISVGSGTSETGMSASLTSLTTCTTYHFRAEATNSGGTTHGNDVTFVTAGCSMGTIAVSPASLHFEATKAGASGELTSIPPEQTVTVTFNGQASAWTASGDQTWLQVTGGLGETAGTFSIAIVNPGNVIGGSTRLTGGITVTAPDAPNSPRTIPVTLTVDHGWGKNYRVGDGTGQGSPVELASDPLGKLYALQSRTDFGRYETQFWSSTDQGKTWGPPASINPADETVMLLPSIAVGSNRAINIVWMGKLDDIDNDIFFTRSTDEGATWSANLDIIPLANRAPNQVSPVIVADPRSGKSNNLYVAMRTYETGVEHVFTIRSTDGGATWGNLVQVPYPNTVDIYKINSLNMQMDTNGMLYLVFDEYMVGENRIFFTRSGDGGVSWEPVKPITPLNECGVAGVPSLKLGEAGVAYVAFVVKNYANACGRGDSDQLQLMLTRSLDSGQSWNPPTQIGPLNLSGYFRTTDGGDEDGNLSLEVLTHKPGLADDEMVVVWSNDNWLDNGLFTADNTVVRSIQSVDGGAHWDETAQLYGEVMLPSDEVNANNLNHFYPDTIVHRGQVLAVWVDDRVTNFVYPFISALGGAAEENTYSIYLPLVLR